MQIVEAYENYYSSKRYSRNMTKKIKIKWNADETYLVHRKLKDREFQELAERCIRCDVYGKGSSMFPQNTVCITKCNWHLKKARGYNDWNIVTKNNTGKKINLNELKYNDYNILSKKTKKIETSFTKFSFFLSTEIGSAYIFSSGSKLRNNKFRFNK